MIERSLLRRTAKVLAAIGLALGAVGCTSGAIGDRGNPTQPTVPPVVNPPPAGYTPEEAGLRRLTIPQYRNSVNDLFGAGMAPTTDFEPDTTLSGFASIGAARVGLSSTITEQFEAAARDTARRALADAGVRAKYLGCAPATAVTDDNCTQTFLRTVGRKAWRRPMTDEEVTRYAGVAKNAQTVLKSFIGGLEYGLAGLLMSPYFLYRNEFGVPDPGNGKQVVFNDYELGTRLSYLIWNTTPDDQLLDAAEARQLTTGNGLTTHAQRLLSSSRAPTGLQTFFTELYRLNELDELTQLASVFPSRTDTLGPAMRAETLKFLTDIAFVRGGDFRQMFDSPSTFVNAELAKLYGMSGVTGTEPVAVTMPASSLRFGILGQASFLAGNSQPNRSSPTLRGKFIREMMLCQPVPAPPPNVPKFPDEQTGLTTREKLTQHRTDPACKSCHAAMDPLGLGLENFDGIGAFRTTEAGKPIDANGDLDGAAFAGPRDLAAALKNNKDAAACIAKHVYRYATGHLEGAGEDPVLASLAKGFQDNGYQFRALLEGVVKSPGFVLAAKAQ
jgi:hypothetical protein